VLAIRLVPAILEFMQIHELKTQHKFFAQVWRSLKKFEVRENDRDFKVNDFVVLVEVVEDRISECRKCGFKCTRSVWKTAGTFPCGCEPPPGVYFTSDFEWIPTDNRISARIEFILKADDFPIGLQAGYCVLGLAGIHMFIEEKPQGERQGPI
jgi:hypothetical protein